MSDKDQFPGKYKQIIEQVVIPGVKDILAQCESADTVAFLLNDEAALIHAIDTRFVDNGRSKDVFTEMVRQRASKVNAGAVVLVSEAWSLPNTLSIEEVERLYKQYKEVASMPQRISVVFIALHTHEGSWMGRAPIRSLTPGGLTECGAGRTVDEFEWIRKDGYHGRFSDLLPPRYATPAQVDAYMAMVRQKLLKSEVSPELRELVIKKINKVVRQAPANNLDEKRLDEFFALLVTGGKKLERDE